MTEEYIEYRLESKKRTNIMDPYHDYVLEKIQSYSEISSAIIYDNLLEDFKDFTPSYRTVRLYVCNLRDDKDIHAPRKIRQYMEIVEFPLGFQPQVDMGQKTLKDANGKSVRITDLPC